MDVESDESSNGDLLGDAENDMLLEADGPGAAEEAFNDGTAIGEHVEEAPMRLPRNPSDPTPEEREKHNKTHVPHRPWCAVCMSARGREDKHYTQTSIEMELGLPMVVLDYAQIEDADEDVMAEADNMAEDPTKVQTHEADAPKDGNTLSKPRKRRLMIGRDRWTKQVMAHLVKCKGLGDETIVKRVTQAVDELGYTKVVIKTDGEPAIVAVQEKIAANRVHGTLVENPPAYDPQANGGAERAVAEVKAQLRAIKFGLEKKVGTRIDIGRPMVEWMIPHAADVINRFLVGSDGKTAYYRIHHRWFKAAVFEFGKQVWAKPLRQTNWNKATETKRKLSLRSNWIEGTWVGFNSRSNEHVIVLPGGGPAMRVRTVRARPSSERWSAKAIE